MRMTNVFLIIVAMVLFSSEQGSGSGTLTQLKRQLFSTKSIFHGSRDMKLVALSYDDGPNSRFTPRLVELLEREHVPATFFWLGEQVEYYPSVAQLVAEKGFEIGNHTFDHSNPTKLSTEKLHEQISSTQEIIRQTTNVTPVLFRPPYGSVNAVVRRVAHDFGLDLVLWSLDTEDWRSGMTRERIIETVLDKIRPGDIILMHDRNSRTIDATQELVPLLREQGYCFVTVSALLHAEKISPEIEKVGRSPLLNVVLFTPPFLLSTR